MASLWDRPWVGVGSSGQSGPDGTARFCTQQFPKRSCPRAVSTNAINVDWIPASGRIDRGHGGFHAGLFSALMDASAAPLRRAALPVWAAEEGEAHRKHATPPHWRARARGRSKAPIFIES